MRLTDRQNNIKTSKYFFKFIKKRKNTSFKYNDDNSILHKYNCINGNK